MVTPHLTNDVAQIRLPLSGESSCVIARHDMGTGAPGNGSFLFEKSYYDFLQDKMQLRGMSGFDPKNLPEFLFPFQRDLVRWALMKSRAAIFADTGLGKTPMQLVWADQVVRHENKPVLILTPLAVAAQTVREAAKFGIEVKRSSGDVPAGSHILITNYEKLQHFDSSYFSGVVCDESSAIKAFDGKRRAIVTEFMRLVPFRSLWTATAAPNDYIELGTSSEALGELGQIDMLNRFFKNDQNTSDMKKKWRGQDGSKNRWRFKGHAEDAFWRWVCSWARACRSPSDLGYDDDGFLLPPLVEREHIVEAREPLPGMLFTMAAQNFREERIERRRTIQQRCELVAELVKTKKPVVVWCHLNDEGDLLERMIPDSVQVSGADSDEKKERSYMGFVDKQIRVLVIKPKIGAWGMNWQHCNHVITFASHSYEQYYQAVRRCWRFGQKKQVVVDLIASEGEANIKENMRRKSEAADRMFTRLVQHMNEANQIKVGQQFDIKTEVPSWL